MNKINLEKINTLEVIHYKSYPRDSFVWLINGEYEISTDKLSVVEMRKKWLIGEMDVHLIFPF